jgi:hypothetical protein
MDDATSDLLQPTSDYIDSKTDNSTDCERSSQSLFLGGGLLFYSKCNYFFSSCRIWGSLSSGYEQIYGI